MKKLTLSMHERDVRTARRIAREHNTSISNLFSRLLRLMDTKRRRSQPNEELPPLTRKLTGIISLPKDRSDREIIEEAMLERHGFDR